MENPRRTEHSRRCFQFSSLQALGRIAAAFVLVALFTGTVHAAQLSLTWQDNSDNEDGFEIERAVGSESFELIATVGADLEAFTDEDVTPGLPYDYRVRAFNAFGYSGYTNVSRGLIENTAPSVSEIEGVSVLKGEQLDPIEFSFGDDESGSSELVVEAISSNLDLVPLENLSLHLNGGAGLLTVSPNGFSVGSSEVTLLVSDGVAVSQKSFTFEVRNNFAPTVSSIGNVSVFEGQSVGPVSFSISDSETSSSDLIVTASSSDEDMINSGSIEVTGTGDQRQLRFVSNSGVSGSTSIIVTVSDGVYSTNGVLPVAIKSNRAPEINGLGTLYAIGGGTQLTALAFSVGDFETTASDLIVEVSSTNSMLLGGQGLVLKGSGASRTLDITPAPGAAGSLEVTVSVSDGARSTKHNFTLRILPSEALVSIIDFSVVDGLAVLEVENREGASFSLWKLHGRGGSWEEIENANIELMAGSTLLIDPVPVAGAVCYQVIASR